MSLARTVTDETFDAEVICSPRPVIVAYRAQWCGPCRQLAPVLEAIATDRAGEVDLVELDVDENPQTARRFSILHVPTTAVFSGGEPVRQVIGAKSKAALLRDLAGVL
ncbi:MAG TPA: thioredoxin domain-containing protein [Streptosporangiaceae bacterium]